MKINIKEYSKQSSLIGSIISLCIGGLLFTKADEVLDIISIGLGIIIAIVALIALVVYARDSREGYNSSANLAVGVILIIVSIIFIFCHEVVENVIRYIIGGYILFTGVVRLLAALQTGIKTQKGLSVFIVSILLILIGIYTIVTENVFLSTVGLIMIIYSIVEIVGYIFYSKKDNVTSETILIETIEEDNEEKEDIKEEIKPEKKKATKKTGKIKEAKTTNEKKKKEDKLK